MMLGAVSWTVFSTREYPPEQLKNFDDAGVVRERPLDVARSRRDGAVWLGSGVIGLLAIYTLHWDRQLYLLAGGITVYGAALLVLSTSRSSNMFTSIMTDVHDMPEAMRRLAVVQFFSWFALFAMWLYTTAAVTQLHFGTSDVQLAGVQRRSELGRCAVRRLQRLRRAGRHRDSVHGAALGIAREPLDQCVAGRGRAHFIRDDSRSAVVAGRDDRCRVRVGLDPVAALCAAVR